MERLTRAQFRNAIAALAMLLLVCASRAQEPKGKAKPALLQVTGQLSRSDPTYPNRANCHFKRFDHPMVAGVAYTVDMVSTHFDAYLLLEDASGHIVAADDDSGGSLNARINFRAPATATYHIIATTCFAGKTGKFTLTAVPATVVEQPGQSTEPVALDRASEVAIVAHAPMLNNTPVGTQEDSHGYVEYRFVAANSAADTAHRVTLTMPRRGGLSRPGYYLRLLRRTAELGPGMVQTISLFQPNLPLVHGPANLEIMIDGRVSPLHVPVNLQQDRGTRIRSPESGPLVFTRSILAPSGIDGTLGSQYMFGHIGPELPQGANVPAGVPITNVDGKRFASLDRFRGLAGGIASWSRHWLGYSSYDGVVLPATEWRAAPAEVRQALQQYVECGGSLVIAGAPELPAEWQGSRHEQAGLISYYPGFGQCMIAPDANPAKWPAEHLRTLSAVWEQSARPFVYTVSPDAAHKRFPVVDDVAIPIRDLFLVMLVFCVLIGPVNVLALSWLGRRIWLLWTVPAFSLLTCIAVVAFMSATEDWHGTVRAEGLTILDEATQRAVSIGWLGLYSPQTPGDGLHFSRDTELTPHLHTQARRQYPSRSIDWTDDQHLTSGWLTARTPSYFLVRTAEQRAERLTVERDAGGSLTIGNALGATIVTAWVADADGTIYVVEDVAPDGASAARRTPQRAGGTLSKLREAFARDWLPLVDDLAAQPQAYLRPGCYIAVLDAAPFIPQGLAGASPHRCRSVVFGIMGTR